MEYLIIIGVIGAFSYLVMWSLSRESKAAERRFESYADAIKKNREADAKLDNPDYRERMLDKDND